MRLLPVIALCSVLLTPLQAQQVSAPEPPEAPQEKSLVGRVSNIFTGPLHPVTRTVVSGAGLGVGLGYNFPTSGRWETVAEAVVTFRRYWSAELQTRIPGRARTGCRLCANPSDGPAQLFRARDAERRGRPHEFPPARPGRWAPSRQRASRTGWRQAYVSKRSGRTSAAGPRRGTRAWRIDSPHLTHQA